MTPEETACAVKCRQSGIIRQLRHNYELGGKKHDLPNPVHLIR